jgi:hypothetical protein
MDTFFTLSDDSWIDSPSVEEKKKRKPLTSEQKEQLNLKRRKTREEKVQTQNLITDLNTKLIQVTTTYEKDKIEYHKLVELFNVSQNNERILKEENNKLRIKLEYVADENSKLIVLQSKLDDKSDEVLEENVKLKIKLIDMEIEYDRFEAKLDEIISNR